MRDLRESRPRFIADASRVGYTLSYQWIYDLEHYPPLANYLSEYYTRAATLDDIDIYQRIKVELDSQHDVAPVKAVSPPCQP